MATKVLTIVGTRPEIIKLSRVIAELDRRVDHVLVHTGQNYDYELNELFFNELGIRRPDHFLDAAGTTPAQTIANVIARTDELLQSSLPDALLLLGDTNSCLAAVAAKRRRIPIFHMEAGNRCFDQRVPEEINRKIVDHLSDINLTYTEHARCYLLAEGLRPETIIKTGSPMQEVLAQHQSQIAASEVLHRLQVEPGEYFVVSAHREESIDDPGHFENLRASLGAVAEKYGKTLLFSAHPRTRKRLEACSGLEDKRIRILKPFGFFDYVKLQQHAYCVLSDSGTLTEEASLLGFPAVMLRQTHERPEGMDEGTLVMSGLQPERVLEAIAMVTAQHAAGYRSRVVSDYATEAVSIKVVRIILSYIDYVKRTVWSQ